MVPWMAPGGKDIGKSVQRERILFVVNSPKCPDWGPANISLALLATSRAVPNSLPSFFNLALFIIVFSTT